jgi:hypothetical protein
MVQNIAKNIKIYKNTIKYLCKEADISNEGSSTFLCSRLTVRLNGCIHTKEELNMEVRIAKLTMLLNRAVESSAKTNTNSDNNDEQFTPNLPSTTAQTEEKRQEKNEIDSHAVYITLSEKGNKHSRMLKQQQALEDAEDEDVSLLEADTDDVNTRSTYHEQMTDKLQGLSHQVINGELSTTDKMNFDVELKSLMSLLDNADDEIKCQLLSDRINDLTILINDATEYRNNHMALSKLLDPDYDKDY